MTLIVIFIIHFNALNSVLGQGLFDDTPDVPVTVLDENKNLSLIKRNDSIILLTDLDEPTNILGTLKSELEPYTKKSPLLSPIGPLDFIDDDFIDNLRRVERSVGLISGDRINNATGFLISPSLFITNNHVIASKEQLKNAKVTFNYQLKNNRPLIADTYYVNESFFITNNDTDQYDYTIIKLQGFPGNDTRWGYISLASSYDDVLELNSAVNIIQHPGGGYKQYAIQDNMLMETTVGGLIHYRTDTIKGSSGSPLFDNNWNLIGIHHAHTKPMIQINGLYVDSNEGIQIKKIKEDLKMKLKDELLGKSILDELYLSQ